MMKRRATYQIRGHQSAVGTKTVYRLMPNRYARHVGHFVFLDQGFQFPTNLPAKNKPEDPDYIAVQANELPVSSGR